MDDVSVGRALRIALQFMAAADYARTVEAMEQFDHKGALLRNAERGVHALADDLDVALKQIMGDS